MHSPVSSAAAAVRQMLVSESSSVTADVMARPVSSSELRWRFCSCCSRKSRALHTATAAGPASRTTSSQSSSVKRRPSRFSISVRQPTTPLSRK